MELKRYKTTQTETARSSSNRTFMELKHHSDGEILNEMNGSNRTFMELKHALRFC